MTKGSCDVDSIKMIENATKDRTRTIIIFRLVGILSTCDLQKLECVREHFFK